MTGSSGSRDQFRRLAVLIGVNFVDMIGFMIVLPLLPFYALKLNATPEVVGQLIASYSIAQLVAAPLWGRVSDRYGRRPALLIGLSASALAYLVFGFATSVWLLLLSRVVQGAGGGTTGVAQAAPGVIAAILCIINVILAYWWLPESRKATVPPVIKARKPLWHPAWLALRHPTTPIGRLLWIYGIGMLAFSSMTSIMALYLGAEFGFNEKTIGYVFLYVGILSFVMRSLLLGLIVDRIGEIWTMRTGTLLLVIGLALYPLPRELWTLALVIPLVPIGTALLFPATTSLMSRLADPGELGTTMGVAQTFAGLARVVAPLLATTLFQRLGHGWPFFVAGGFVALVGIMAFQVDVHPRPAERAAEGAGA